MNWFVDNNKWVEADLKASKNEPWRKYYKGPRVSRAAMFESFLRSLTSIRTVSTAQAISVDT